MKRNIAIVCLVLAAAVMGWWYIDGMHMANQAQISVEVEKEDDFGDMVKTTEWRDEFHLGLMDGALPAAGGLVGIAMVLLFMGFREGKKAASGGSEAAPPATAEASRAIWSASSVRTASSCTRLRGVLISTTCRSVVSAASRFRSSLSRAPRKSSR